MPFSLMRPNDGVGQNEDGDEGISNRSYNLMGDEDPVYIEQIMAASRVNAFRNFDDYEALLNLDDNIVTALPERYLNQLPVSRYTQENHDNFAEENKNCTICMCHYEIADLFLILPCLHRFHSGCIKEWL